MEQYLHKEKEILELTNSDFFDHEKVVTNWYSVKQNEIIAHNKLVNAMGLQPDYLILSRYEKDSLNRRITIYFNYKVEIVPYIPFGNWKLFDNILKNGSIDSFNVQDPTGTTKTIHLNGIFQFIPKELQRYLTHSSFEEYYSNVSKTKNDNEKLYTKPEEITLEHGKSYLIRIK